MSVHDANRTDAPGVCGLPRTPDLVVTSATVKAPLRACEAAQFENDRQALLWFNPSPDCDSIAEHLVSLLRPGVAVSEVVADVLALGREAYESNERERGHEHAATGHLSLLHRTLHADGHRSVNGLSIVGAAARLRGPLKVIRQAHDPHDRPDWLAFMHASWAIKDVVCLLPAEALRGSYLRNELGKGPHDVLLSIIDGDAATNAAGGGREQS